VALPGEFSLFIFDGRACEFFSGQPGKSRGGQYGQVSGTQFNGLSKR
jgi:hypothetical protein